MWSRLSERELVMWRAAADEVIAIRDGAESQEEAETRARDELMEVVASIPCLHKNDNPHTTSTELLACVIEAIRAEQREADALCIPTNWTDPLLSGPGAALRGSGSWGCPDIERLLLALAAAIRNAKLLRVRRTQGTRSICEGKELPIRSPTYM